MIELNRIYNEDCLEGMKRVPDGSVDLVLTDPPYNIGKAKWDKIPNYIEWCGKWLIECQRVLKDNGSFYWWHNDMVQIAQLMEWIRANTGFVFNSFIVWDKGDFRALSWKNPSKDNNLRSWFNTCEYCLYYTFQDETGLTGIYANGELFKPIKEYLNAQKGNTTNQQINELLDYPSAGGGYASHYFTDKGKQWGFITQEHYNKLQTKTGRFQREYESLRREYEDLRYVHSLDANHNNVWKSTEHNSGKQHPTQKPLDLMERIVKTSSKEDGVILDPFMGSGTTAIACINTTRNYIGFELDKHYCDMANERIQKALAEKAVSE